LDLLDTALGKDTATLTAARLGYLPGATAIVACALEYRVERKKMVAGRSGSRRRSISTWLGSRMRGRRTWRRRGARRGRIWTKESVKVGSGRMTT
jgi:hypothetical protein